MDIHPANLDFCRTRLQRFDNVSFTVNSGFDFRPIEDGTASAIFCYDAMVHFNPDIVESYVIDTARVLRPSGLALYHHSNYSGAQNERYTKNPHGRNVMSQAEFCGLAARAGLQVVESFPIHWGGMPDLDCVTLVLKP